MMSSKMKSKRFKKQPKKQKNPSKKQTMENLIASKKQKLRAKEIRIKRREIEQELKREEKKKVAEGKKPYFMKQSEMDRKVAEKLNLKKGSGKTRMMREQRKARKELKGMGQHRY